MHRLRRKLNSERGATMMMALLLLALAVMVSAVIISAALTNAKHLQAERTQEQAFLTISSAAELLTDSLKGQEYVVKLKKVDVTQHVRNEETGETEDVFYEGTWSGALPSPSDLGAFGSLLHNGIKQLGYKGNTTGDASPVSFRISVGRMQDVLVTFCMKKDYSITAQLELDPEKGDGRYRMYLTLQGDFTDSGVSYSDVISDDGQTSTRTSTQTYTIRWINPKIEKGAAPA